MLFPKQLADPKQRKSVVLTPLLTFKELMDNVEKIQVYIMLLNCSGVPLGN